MGTIYGYARVSTQHQNLARQIRSIQDTYPEADIYAEKYTGTKMARPKWEKLFNKVSSGDTIVFDSVSRMSRNAEEGYQTYEYLFNKGVNLEFIKEPMVNTSVYRKQIEDAKHRTIQLETTSGSRAIDNFTSGLLELVNCLFMDMAAEQIRIAFDRSEKEVKDIHDRVSGGVRAAIDERGKLVGGLTTKGTTLTTQKSREAKEIIKKHSKDFGGSLNDGECMKLVGIARNTFYKYKREIKEERGE